MYKAYITKLKNIRKHSNADRLLVGECFGNNVIVGLDYQEGEIGIYFPVDGKLGLKFAEVNNLLRKKDENGNNIGGYLDPDKRNITAIKLRGEKSDGLFMKLNCLQDFTDITKLKDGDQIDILNGVVICEKYIPKTNRRNLNNSNSIKGKKKTLKSLYPYFEEHKDTEQLAYNLNEFKKGDICYITLKMHGTSQRTAYTLVKQKLNWFQKLFKIKLPNKYELVTGTRRVNLGTMKESKPGFYDSELFRKKYHDLFSTKLHKGEEVFYEVLGYTDTDKLIMGECDNLKTKDPEFIKQYGQKTKFTYGCYSSQEAKDIINEKIKKSDVKLEAMANFFNFTFINDEQLKDYPQNKIFVYRMTLTTEEGYVVEYPTELVQKRCEEMGVDFVPIFEKFIFRNKTDLLKRIDKYVDGPDPIGKNHIREGIVLRIDNKLSFKAYKHKNFNFKVLEGLIKSDAKEPDMEENQ